MIRVRSNEAVRLMSTPAEWRVKQVGRELERFWQSEAVLAEWQARRRPVFVGAGKIVAWLDDVTWAERSQ